MAELKTKATIVNPLTFIEALEDEKKKEDSLALLDLMKAVTGEEPVLWSNTIIGFGNYHYRYASGREGNWFLTGFSPRKQNLSIYLTAGADKHPELLKKLGKHKIGKGCLYIKNLEAVDLNVLRELISKTVSETKKQYPSSPD